MFLLRSFPRPIYSVDTFSLEKFPRLLINFKSSNVSFHFIRNKTVCVKNVIFILRILFKECLGLLKFHVDLTQLK